MLHVLFIPSWYKSYSNPIGGVFFFEQALALTKAGIKVGIVYPEIVSARSVVRDRLFSALYRITEVDDAGIATLRMKILRTAVVRFNYRSWAESAVFLAKTYFQRRGKPDLIHVQSALMGGRAAFFLKRDIGIPYVISEHSSNVGLGLLKPWHRAQVATAYRNADAVVSVSKVLADGLSSICPASDIQIVPNMVSTAVFSLPPAERKNRPFLFLSVANLKPIKNLDLLIRAFSRAFGDSDDVRLKIIGQGELRPRLENLCHQLRLSNRVLFAGQLSRIEVRNAMWEANALVHTSEYETFGMVLIEAMATGLPIICTACGAAEEIVMDDLGIVTPVGDLQALASAMVRLFKAGDNRSKELARRQHIEQHFSAEAFVRRIALLYGQVLSPHRGHDRQERD